MNSMTGFSRVQVANDAFSLTWEMKSVNHRFLDQFYRLPESWRFIEPQLRQILNKTLNRGRVEVVFQYKLQNTTLPQVNMNLLSQLVGLSKDIANQYQIQDDLSTSHCLGLPLIWSNQDTALTEEQVEVALESFAEAVKQLCAHRKQEGRAITELLTYRVEKLKTYVTHIRELSSDSLVVLKEKLKQKISALYTGHFDEQRLEQELIFQVMRLDIAEELDRLVTHLTEIQRVLLEKGANGRRLDFLVQECHRETNTIGSKTDSSQVSQIAIDMKVLIEQMREQIQNVE
jgi:uncharacterized protein (TIGR00255 family)